MNCNRAMKLFTVLLVIFLSKCTQVPPLVKVHQTNQQTAGGGARSSAALWVISSGREGDLAERQVKVTTDVSSTDILANRD
ncbi:hypothetical protein KUDE01_021609 [Dissostichus eleginoides]|uniref:Uncharacterized protein n=1 Tax=Dissostichus eleginoides TaxID=100907 RepID=A0AAD9C8C4_DISEL|nr:hypothetical protein KUDE01_021609 [Dissostichus eleginoides]